jgi:AraC-like DNA-binding protein
MSGVAQPKERSVVTSDLDEARELLTRRYCPHNILLTDRRATLDVRYSHLPLQNISFNSLQYGAEVAIRPKEFETFYMVHIPLAGRATIRANGRHFVVGGGWGVIVSPNHCVSTTWTADCRQLMLKIDRQAIERCVSQFIYQPINRPLEFFSEINLTYGLGTSLYNLVQYLWAELARSDAMARSKLISTQLEQTLIALLLSGVDHSYRDALQATGKSICPKHVLKAYQYMVDHAQESITMEDLTRITGVSGRALYDGFRRFKGAPPRASLNAIRMEGAHRDLIKADDRDDVTVIAQRWGFFHLGRFASNYEKIFGEKPSHTLRRGR